jgi:hypothetical protein
MFEEEGGSSVEQIVGDIVFIPESYVRTRRLTWIGLSVFVKITIFVFVLQIFGILLVDSCCLWKGSYKSTKKGPQLPPLGIR